MSTPGFGFADTDLHGREDDVMVNVAPWVLSLLVHLSVIVLALFLVWATINTPEEPPSAGFAGKILDMPEERNRFDEAVKVNLEDSKPAPRTSTFAPRPNTVRDAPMDRPTDTHGITGGEPQLGPIGLSPVPGGDGNLFGVRDPGEPDGTPPKSVVFIIDASGSLIDTMPFVVHELKRAISDLKDTQRFTVIFFQNGQAVEVPVPSRGLKRATPAAKEAVKRWIDLPSGNVLPGGRTHPTEAIRMALGYRPEAAYILSDNILGGRSGPTPEQLLEDVRRFNVASTRVNTIQFFYPDPLEAMGRAPILKEIAEETGGKYGFIRPSDIEHR